MVRFMSATTRAAAYGRSRTNDVMMMSSRAPLSPRAPWSARAQRGICFLAMVLAACSKDAPPPSTDVQPLARVELDSNRTVEIIGLRRWTADMVRDSLKKYAPDEGLDSDAAAANLRNLLGFADAATSTHSVVFHGD